MLTISNILKAHPPCSRYFTTFIGWLVAAFTNSHAPKFLGLGALLSLGAALQLLSQSLRAWGPPFGLFAITFFFTGLGQAYQDSHANTFVSSVKTAHRWLGFIHAMYGFGCLVSPFVATTVASSNPSRWMLFYLFPLGLSLLNLTSVVLAFGNSLHIIRTQPQNDSGENTSGRNRSAMNEVRQVLKLHDLWIISLFYFLYLGVSFAAGGNTPKNLVNFTQGEGIIIRSTGWVVKYLVDVRHGNLATMGYVPSGYYGGVFLGRLILAEPTHRFGERRMLSIYSALCFAMQLVFWLVPNIISSAVAFSLMGFLLGPAFAAVRRLSLNFT
jgi:fucose permease